ncbi:hypothetical protein HMN09_00985300 [Mycena chlorophos]|uniref:Thioesterase family protein n=1 Tax=Mycena chlorophos TaxID=658473 RepID=A0A8H6W2Z0_MYCCL|nr:hypothetical protein HMN09_00985300 [Mycena chlorophos]
MAPLHKALSTHFATRDGQVDIYEGTVDDEWLIRKIPNGGYVLGLVVQACVERQASTAHPDPIHVTSHFLQATSVAPFQVHIRVLKTSRQFTNLIANLVQDAQTRITTHLIFSNLHGQPSLGLSPTSPFARRHPLHIHPARAIPTRMPLWNLPSSPDRTTSTTVGGGGLVWGAWMQLLDADAKITPAALSFIADTFINLPALLPPEERQGIVPRETWFPTMTMSLEYKNHPNPSPNTHHATRTVGIFSSGTFWGAPSGRHDVYVEIWTAPAELGSGSGSGGVLDEKWRDGQVCLATSTQMALCLPANVNAKGKKEKGDAKL